VDSVWIGFVGGLVPTVLTALVALRQTREAKRLATLNSDLQANMERLKSELATEQHERIALKDRELNAEDVLTHFREPLAAAAFDLQSRCYNIVSLNFFGKFGTSHDRFPEAQKTTIFRFAQYFGWTEILRREIQFLSFPEEQDTRCVAQLQSQIAGRLANSTKDEPLMIWVDQQRAIGERMIVEEHGKVLCMGYARFCDEYDASFAPLCRHMIDDVHDPGAVARLGDAQHLLCKLVMTLDKEQLRYTKEQLGQA